MAQLELPSARHKDSYLAAVHEFQQAGEDYPNADSGWLAAHFDDLVQDLLTRADPAKPRPNRVPETIYWLVEIGEFIGQLSLRHYLNPFLELRGGHIGYEIRPSMRRRGYGKLILKLGLEKASELGLRRVLITCDSTNIASRKIIEANGGQFDNEIRLPGRPVNTLRFWIDIPNTAKESLD